MDRKPKHDWVSRKLWFSVFAIGVLYLGMSVAMESAVFISIYGSFVGGVVGVAGLFLGSNVLSGKFEKPKDPPKT